MPDTHAPAHDRLENCAAWHMEMAERQPHRAEHHDMIAFRLFRQAHELRSQSPLPAAA